ncbi:hypothetical protein Tco_0569629 [Tanacetum coccineum]
MTSMNTRLNIEKLDDNIVQKHRGSKQVGLKQLGSKQFRDREAEVFQVSNDDTAVTQRWLEDKQPEENTNTDCLVKEREKDIRSKLNIASPVAANDVVLKLGSCSLVVNCMGTWGGGAVVEGVVLVVVVMNMAAGEKMVAIGLGCRNEREVERVKGN